MRESKIYLDFFKKNLIIILVMGILGGMGAVGWRSGQPKEYKASSLYQMKYTQENINKRVTMTDQAVSLLRSSQVKEQLKMQKLKATIYKSGPLSVDVSIQGADKDGVEDGNKAVGEYLKSNFPITQIGLGNLEVLDKKTLFFATAGFGVGALMGVLVGLIKTYLRNF